MSLILLDRKKEIHKEKNIQLTLKRENEKIQKVCNCDLSINGKHKENCIYNLV
jgi:copper(I)-binding protein